MGAWGNRLRIDKPPPTNKMIYWIFRFWNKDSKNFNPKGMNFMLTLSQLFKKLSKKQTSKNFFWKEKLLLWQIHSKRKMLR